MGVRFHTVFSYPIPFLFKRAMLQDSHWVCETTGSIDPCLWCFLMYLMYSMICPTVDLSFHNLCSGVWGSLLNKVKVT